MRQFGYRLTTAVVVALVLAIGLSGTASATVVVGSHGVTGELGTHDSQDTPEGKCGYSAENSSGEAFLRWIRVIPPQAIARDVTAGRDSQQIKWKFKIQRSTSGGPWKNVASSPVQTKTAYDDTPAPFKAMKVYANGTSGMQRFRATVTVTWVRNGSDEGWIKFWIEYYSVKWTVGNPEYVFSGGCPGSAD